MAPKGILGTVAEIGKHASGTAEAIAMQKNAQSEADATVRVADAQTRRTQADTAAIVAGLDPQAWSDNEARRLEVEDRKNEQQAKQAAEELRHKRLRTILTTGAVATAGVAAVSAPLLVAGTMIWGFDKTKDTIQEGLGDAVESITDTVTGWFGAEPPLVVTNEAVLGYISFPDASELVTGLASGKAGADTTGYEIFGRPIRGFRLQHEGSMPLVAENDNEVHPIGVDIVKNANGSDTLAIEVMAESIVVVPGKLSARLSDGDQEGFMTDLGGNDGTQRSTWNQEFLASVLGECRFNLRGAMTEGLQREASRRLTEALALVEAAGIEPEVEEIVRARLLDLNSRKPIVTYVAQANGGLVEVGANELPMEYKKNPDGTLYNEYTVEEYAADLGADPNRITQNIPVCTTSPDAFNNASSSTATNNTNTPNPSSLTEQNYGAGS